MNTSSLIITALISMTVSNVALSDDTPQFDDKGDRIEQHLDLKGDRIQEQFDNRAEKAYSAGNEDRGQQLELRGENINNRLDNKGERIDDPYDPKKSKNRDQRKAHHEYKHQPKN